MDLPAAIISRPPRPVPLSTRLVILFGGTLAPLGWIFGGFGMMFAILFVGKADLSSLIDFRGALETASGVVTACEQTHASEGGSKHSRGTPIYRYEYQFKANDVEWHGTSYHKGETIHSGEAVTVEFPAGRPACSRIQGMRRALFGPGAALVLIFPAIGLVFIILSLRGGMRNLALLINGEMASARFTSQEATSMTVNRKRVYKVCFEFTDRNGTRQSTFTRSATPERLEAAVFEPLFYNPERPARTALLHAMPRNLSLDERGAVNTAGVMAMVKALVPLAVAGIFIAGAVFLQQVLFG